MTQCWWRCWRSAWRPPSASARRAARAARGGCRLHAAAGLQPSGAKPTQACPPLLIIGARRSGVAGGHACAPAAGAAARGRDACHAAARRCAGGEPSLSNGGMMGGRGCVQECGRDARDRLLDDALQVGAALLKGALEPFCTPADPGFKPRPARRLWARTARRRTTRSASGARARCCATRSAAVRVQRRRGGALQGVGPSRAAHAPGLRADGPVAAAARSAPAPALPRCLTKRARLPPWAGALPVDVFTAAAALAEGGPLAAEALSIEAVSPMAFIAGAPPLCF